MYILINLVVLLLKILFSIVKADNQYSFLLSGSNLEWPSVTEESNDILYGRYDPRKILVRGIQMDGDRAYVSMPRFMKTGVPWTLGVFHLEFVDFEPDIRPYPDYNYHMLCNDGRCGNNCLRIVNVVDVFIESGVLWALDAGTTNVFRKPMRLGSAQLIGVNLTTDTVIRVTDLSSVTGTDSRLEHVVAMRTRCNRLYVYVSDAGRHAIVVYNARADRLHSIPLPERVSVAHHRRIALYLMPVNKADKSYVYFTYRQSGTVYMLDSWSEESVTHGSVTEVGVKPVDMLVLGTDRGTSVYFRTAGGGNTDIWMWDVNRPLDVCNFVLVHRTYLYLTPIAVVAGWRGLVWSLESNYDEYLTDSVDCTGPRTLLRPFKKVVEHCPTDGCR
ncbi:Six-bladed beta-propeller, TolB-like,Major royal jelly protein/protein yellow [Cinara cedri]|uniref:Six-bladed beta-propeller, TolB-like,Major royal jelly protein/protein yellow n=1 Tax=Cinara cedri TaxID=506608 RepID=A0A5E4NGG2_9HEMI|nr:Six-bladed beta-propeller, TolB-like,Major royal jelly protein/protein yellow [Cinara cedri]